MSSSNAGEAPVAAPATTAARQADTGLFAPLRNALLDSRQRWRDLVNMAADFAFETDAHGRFSFVMPDPALGWTRLPTACLSLRGSSVQHPDWDLR